jgi:hypothetical protein
MLHLRKSNKPVGNQINPDLNICIVSESETGEKTLLLVNQKQVKKHGIMLKILLQMMVIYFMLNKQ